MSITKAVASSVKTPGTYIQVDLLGAASNPGGAPLRALIMSPQNSSGGNLTDDTEVRQCFGPDDARAAFGPGNPGHLAAKLLFLKYGIAAVDVISPTPSAGAVAAATQTFSGTTTENSTVQFRGHGRTIDVPWNSGEGFATFVTRAVATINAQGDDLFFTVADSGAGVLTTTCKAAGPWGNDVLIAAEFIDGGAGGTIVGGASQNLAGGTTEPDFSTALAQVNTREYRCIGAALSNADATLATSSSNGDRLKVHINTFETGAGALLQVGIIGHTGTIANAQGGAIDRNDEAMEYVYGQDFEDVPGELMGDEIGDTIAAVSLRANANRIGNKANLYGPRDPVASKLTAAEVESLLNNGVSPYDLERGTNEVFMVRPITTHSLNGGSPDFRALDISDTYGMYAVADDLRAVLPVEFANTSISPDLPQGSDPLPTGVVELRDVKAFTLDRVRLWTDLGVVQVGALDEAIRNGDVGFEIDAGDATQVNIFLPLAIIKPLAKLSVVTSKAS